MFAKKLKSLRESIGITQKALSEKLDIPQSTYALYETGNREPGFQVLRRIAKYFNVSSDYLLGLSGYMNEKDIVHVSAEMQMLEGSIKWLSNQERTHFNDIFEQLVRMYDKLRGTIIVDMYVTEGFLESIEKLLYCIESCCDDAEIVSQLVLYGADNMRDELGESNYDYYASEVKERTSSMERESRTIINKILDRILEESIKQLAAYFGETYSAGTESQNRKLDKIAALIKKAEGGETSGDSKKEN
jgi:transcriptional regulator with XRE-family HTH domain